MNGIQRFWRGAGLVAATTIGAGMFSLPYVFHRAGWLLGIFYVMGLSVAVIVSHALYWRVLSTNHEKNRLLGLTRERFGRPVFNAALVVLVGGLVLALVVYLILANDFLQLLAPSLNSYVGLIGFWVTSSLPIVLNLRKLIGLELAGTVFMVAVIFYIFSGADLSSPSLYSAPFDVSNFFLPFAPLLFSLAAWTVVEPLYDYQKKYRDGRVVPWGVLIAGTALAAALYLFFVLGILGSTSAITPDALSGLVHWSRLKLALLGGLGLFAIWTSYIPIGLEIRNLLEKDLRWRKGVSLAAVFVAPILLLAVGLKDFLTAVGLVGGVFLSLQYVLIIAIAGKVLAIKGRSRFFLITLSAIFVAAAVYEIYRFVLH